MQCLVLPSHFIETWSTRNKRTREANTRKLGRLALNVPQRQVGRSATGGDNTQHSGNEASTRSKCEHMLRPLILGTIPPQPTASLTTLLSHPMTGKRTLENPDKLLSRATIAFHQTSHIFFTAIITPADVLASLFNVARELLISLSALNIK